jgi:serine/threonine-protein kinase
VQAQAPVQQVAPPKLAEPAAPSTSAVVEAAAVSTVLDPAQPPVPPVAFESPKPDVVEGPPGKLNLAVSPWGEVQVDGRHVGVTPPLTQLNLPPGKHTIAISNGDAPVYKKVITVRSGRTYAIDHQF